MAIHSYCTKCSIYGGDKVFAVPDNMAQSEAIVSVLDSQSPRPDSYSLSPLHPFFSTKVGLSVYLSIFASIRLCSLFFSVHEGKRDVVQVLLVLTSMGLLYSRKYFSFSYTGLYNHVNHHIYQHPRKRVISY